MKQNSGVLLDLPEGIAATQATERHFSVKELADSWNLDESSIRKMFMDEPGVIKFGRPGIRKKRRQYVTLRIPQSVMLRVYYSRVNQSSAFASPDPSVVGRRQRTEHSASR